MKIELPLENWSDLLPSVPRRQLVQLLFQLGDRQFARILQFFLTEVGQITLGHLRIVASRENDPNGGGPVVEVRKGLSDWEWTHPHDLETNLPEVPMPKNVKDFKRIELSYFDESVANFLLQFQHEEEQHGNSLLDNVNLCFAPSISLPRDDNTIMPILAQLMPMIGNGNINSMHIYDLHHTRFGCDGLEPNNAASQLMTTMLTNARILGIGDHIEMSMSSWRHWLYASRNDGKPRVLRLRDSTPDIGTKNLIGEIKKDFSMATCPVSFFVYVCVRAFERGDVDWQDICLDNGQTNERLVVKTFDPPSFSLPLLSVLISRYPVAANKAWIAANEQEIMEWKFRKHSRLLQFERSLVENGGNV